MFKVQLYEFLCSFIDCIELLIKVLIAALANVAQLVAMSSYKPKGHRFDSYSRHMPTLWVWPQVGGCVGDNQCFSHVSVSPPLLSEINKNVKVNKNKYLLDHYIVFKLQRWQLGDFTYEENLFSKVLYSYLPRFNALNTF